MNKDILISKFAAFRCFYIFKMMYAKPNFTQCFLFKMCVSAYSYIEYEPLACQSRLHDTS